MQAFIIALLICSATMSVLVILLMASAPVLTKRYSEKSRYYAWLVIVIGLIVPFRPRLGDAIVTVDMSGEMAVPFVRIGNGTPVLTPVSDVSIDIAAAYPSAVDISVWQFAMAVWLAGLIVFLAYHVIKHYRFVKTTLRWSEKIVDEDTLAVFQNAKDDIGIAGKIGLYRCPCVGSPMMIGFLNPRILLPSLNIAQDELGFTLRHELVHHRRKDLLYKYLALIATAMHWFNPIVHMMAKAIDELCEMSCDAEVVQRADTDTRQAYSETIIGVVKYHSKLKTSLSTNFYGGKKIMKNRISTIMDTNKKKVGVAIVCVALLAAVVTGFMFNVQDETSSGKISGEEYAQWLRYVETEVNPYREKIRLAESSDDWTFRGTSMSQLGGYQFSVGNPSELEPVGSGNGGFVQVALWADEYKITIMRFLGNPAVYSLGLGNVVLSSTGGIIANTHGSATDRDGNVLPRHPEDSEEFYQNWLDMYEQYNEEIIDMFSTAKSVFGDLW